MNTKETISEKPAKWRVKYNCVMQSYQPGAKIARLAKAHKVTRQVIYAWRKRLLQAAKYAFQYGGIVKTHERCELANQKLRNRVTELELLCSSHGIQIPPAKYREEIPDGMEDFEEDQEADWPCSTRSSDSNYEDEPE